MSSAREGWYVDPSTGTNLRFWNGSTWTDKVAPLPREPAPSEPTELFGAPPVATPGGGEPSVSSVTPAGATEETGEPAGVTPAGVTEEAGEGSAEVTSAGATEEAGGGTAVEATERSELDPEVEVTLLTRRELRARRGSEPINDTPKHLTPIRPPEAVPVEQLPEVEEVEVPLLQGADPSAELFQGADLSVDLAPPLDSDDDMVAPGRRVRIVRMSVLLGVLAVVSSVGVLTAGRI